MVHLNITMPCVKAEPQEKTPLRGRLAECTAVIMEPVVLAIDPSTSGIDMDVFTNLKYENRCEKGAQALMMS
jgi:hypothetical protein